MAGSIRSRLAVLGVLASSMLCLPPAPVFANQVTNGEFDTNVNGWSGTSGSLSLDWNTSDASSAPGSGSALLTNSGVGGYNGGIHQCVGAVTVGKAYVFGTKLRVASGQSIGNRAGIFMSFFAGTSCNTPTGVVTYAPYTKTDGSTGPLDTWLLRSAQAVAPVSAQSAWVYLNLDEGPSSGGFNAKFDQVFFVQALFADDFEAGDLTAWTLTHP